MKKQAISISLGDLKRLEKQIRKELKDIEKLGIMKKVDKEKIRFQLDIVNYPSQKGTRTMYCSDTWEFELLRGEEIVI